MAASGLSRLDEKPTNCRCISRIVPERPAHLDKGRHQSKQRSTLDQAHQEASNAPSLTLIGQESEAVARFAERWMFTIIDCGAIVVLQNDLDP